MLVSIYCTITGAKQGTFKGESPLTQHAQSIPCLAFESGVSVPFDKSTGQSTGRREWTPVKFTKELGPASPQILQACVTAEVLIDVVFGFYHSAPAGDEELVYSVHLTNATITGIGQSTNPPLHSSPGRDYDRQEVEVIELTYRKIEVASPTGKTAFSDDWSASP